MSAMLARLAILALMSGAAGVSGAGMGWLTILFPRGNEVIVFYDDRDGNGYLSFNAPDPANVDLVLGAQPVSRFSRR